MPADPIFYSGILRRFLTTKVLQSPSFGKKGKMSFLLKSSICKYARTYLVLLLPPIVDSKKESAIPCKVMWNIASYNRVRCFLGMMVDENGHTMEMA